MKNSVVVACVLLCASAFPASAEIYKYTDSRGKVYFTDKPLSGTQYNLEWKRSDSRILEGDGLNIGTRQYFAGRLNFGPRQLTASMKKRRGDYEALISETASRYRLHPELLHAVVLTESAYNPGAVSSAGAVGLMQLMPDTARRYGVRDIWDPKENIKGGASYLRDLLDMFDNDLRLALAAYNAGENAVMRYGNQIPPYSETQDYVRKVLGSLRTNLGDKKGS